MKKIVLAALFLLSSLMTQCGDDTDHKNRKSRRGEIRARRGSTPPPPQGRR